MEGRSISMLGTGLIGDFYTMTLHGQRGRDRVGVVYSRCSERGGAFAERWGIPRSTTSMEEAINDPSTDVVVVALPNFLHEGVDRNGRRRRQGGPLHQAAGPLRRGGQADPRQGGGGGDLRRLPRGPLLHPQDPEGDRGGARAAPSATSPGYGRARPTPGRTAPGSGTRTRRAAAPSSTWAATASRSSATSSARATGRSR